MYSLKKNTSTLLYKENNVLLLVESIKAKL